MTAWTTCYKTTTARPYVRCPFNADRKASKTDPTRGPAEVAVEHHDPVAALDRLPHDQRAADMLVDPYGQDYAEVAEVVGVRAGTIGSGLRRARTALRATVLGAAA